MDKVGKDGVITVEESKTMGTELTVVEGMQFDRGYLSAYMVTNTEKWKLFWKILHFNNRQENFKHSGCASNIGENSSDRQVPPHHSRRC